MASHLPSAACFFQLQCLPLASLLLALDNPTVNYLSLDLEGAELEVLCCHTLLLFGEDLLELLLRFGLWD